ncbi:MAG: CapA family protein [Anaerolineae bacterium]|nr:CapA family protein [Anaerolineae bacterium]
MNRHFLTAIGILLLMALITGVLIAPAMGGAGASTTADLPGYPWLYLRDGQPITRGPGAVSLIAVGDVMLGRGVSTVDDPLGGVGAWLRGSDLVVGNLESAIAGDDSAPPSMPETGPMPYILNAPSTTPTMLRQAGFDILSLANNHTLDYGSVGLATTAARLEQAGLLTTGAGESIEAAYRPLVVDVKGVRLAFLAFNRIAGYRSPDPNGWAIAEWDDVLAIQAIAQAQGQADAVIVSIHWGDEYLIYPNSSQQRIARNMLDAGADLVIGHHPHVVQGTGVSGSGFVAYSLGNFVFDQADLPETRRGLALRAIFDVHGLRGVQALPVSAMHRPFLLPIDESGDLSARVCPRSPRAGLAGGNEICRPYMP